MDMAAQTVGVAAEKVAEAAGQAVAAAVQAAADDAAAQAAKAMGMAAQAVLTYLSGFVGVLLVARFVMPRPGTAVQLCIQQGVLVAVAGCVLMRMLGARWPVFLVLWETWVAMQLLFMQLNTDLPIWMELVLLGVAMPVVLAAWLPFVLPRFVEALIFGA